MKIFIAGARDIKRLDSAVIDKLGSIAENGFDVLVGDAFGVDSAVQKFYADRRYAGVTVFASNGKARNNLGNWPVRSIAVADDIKGFDFYVQKDLAMADEADLGLMIWNGESKGTLNNVINLLSNNKSAVVYFTLKGQFFNIDSGEKLEKLMAMCPVSTQLKYSKLTYKQTTIA